MVYEELGEIQPDGTTKPIRESQDPTDSLSFPPDRSLSPADLRERDATLPYSELPRLGAYLNLGLVGTGAMGEVYRVRDSSLNRSMAMKVMRPRLANHRTARLRFIDEAQATAQLQHPGIVPIHEIGELSDGRPYFTMKEVRGRTLREVIRDVHEASPGISWEIATSGWTFRKLVEAFRKVCETVAYAHSRGVIHRDLKPSNIMVGDFGEVLVMDWGLAKVLDSAHLPDIAEGDAVVTGRLEHGEPLTQIGTVTGTPMYMPPEQARGELDQLGPASDVYSLGAILYHVLSNRPPYSGNHTGMILFQVISGPPRPPGRVPASTSLDRTIDDDPELGLSDPEPLSTRPIATPPLPAELVIICERAMAREIADRYPDAGVMAEAVGAWLEGSLRREQALTIVADAEKLLPQIAQLRERARAFEREGQTQLETIPLNAPVTEKLAAWNLEDEAKRLERQADLLEAQFVQLLQGSLTHVSDLLESHALLADHYRAKHAEAEKSRDARAVLGHEVMLRAHDRGGHAGYLRGDGAVTLYTDPVGASVELLRIFERDRRLIVESVRILGRTPMAAISLPFGSHVLKLTYPGRADVLYPIALERQEHWDGKAPGEKSPRPIYLPRADEVGAKDRYIPAGWCIVGGDSEAFNALPRRRIWMDGFVVRRFPVTNCEYLEFLNTLAKHGKKEQALECIPRTKGGPRGEPGAALYGEDPLGRFSLVPDSHGDLWLPEWPVIQVDWFGAMAYAAWKATMTGIPWRLLSEYEREKAARGVDGRFLPWGDFGDPTWACTLDAHSGRPLPTVVESFPEDSSIYGVRGLGGNVRDWCIDAYKKDGPRNHSRLISQPASLDERTGPRVIRGGAFTTRLINSRAACRYWDVPTLRSALVGFRFGRTLDPYVPELQNLEP